MDRDILKLFDYEAKRRPELAALAASAPHMSDAEIDTVEVPLPWMRQALRQLKDKHEVATLAALIEKTVVDGFNPDPEGVMCMWHGDDTYIKVGRTALLITPGTLLWIDQKGMWIDTIHTVEIDPKVRANVVVRGKVTRSAYNQAIRDQARKSAPIDVASSTVTATPQPPLQTVRFYRPG